MGWRDRDLAQTDGLEPGSVFREGQGARDAAHEAATLGAIVGGQGVVRDDVADADPATGSQHRAISPRTAALSVERLMTQLLMTTSTEASPSGIDSIRPLRNSTFVAPASAALWRASSSISSVMSSP